MHAWKKICVWAEMEDYGDAGEKGEMARAEDEGLRKVNHWKEEAKEECVGIIGVEKESGGAGEGLGGSTKMIKPSGGGNLGEKAKGSEEAKVSDDLQEKKTKEAVPVEEKRVSESLTWLWTAPGRKEYPLRRC